MNIFTISPYIWQILGIVLTTVVIYVGIKIKEIYESKINTEIKKR
jgi:purine-cytosine permease-like protein